MALILRESSHPSVEKDQPRSPIKIFHPTFASFLHDVRSTPLNKVLEADTNQVSLASALRKAMARDEITWRAKLTEQLHRLSLGIPYRVDSSTGGTMIF